MNIRSRPTWKSFAAAVAMAAFLMAAGPAQAGPRDELLRVAPADAAVMVFVQNARQHVHDLSESPFMQWLPTTAIGKKMVDSAEFKQLRESATMILSQLDVTPAALIDDILGDAFAFVYFPPSPERPKEERSLILVRPRKLEMLTKLVNSVNEQQTRSGELKGVIRKQHGGVDYFERQKGALTEYYCFCGNVFAFSKQEPEIKSFIDRDSTAPKPGVKPSELLGRLEKLGITDAAAAILINPRVFDAEIKATAANAKPDEKRFLNRFAEVWTALDSAAFYATLDKGVEVGVAVRFHQEKLPADARKWLTGPRYFTTAARLIPEGAMLGISGQVRASELVALIASLTPQEPGKVGAKEWFDNTIGPIVGREILPLVLDSLGPNWACWAEPPAKAGVLPTLVAAIEISGKGDRRAEAEKALVQAVEFGFKTARVAYNTRHKDQIELKEEKDPLTGATITVLSNDDGFPAGFRPAFALVKGHLVIATSPEAIKNFAVPPADSPNPAGFSRIATFSGLQTRTYLQAHGGDLARFLTGLGVGDEKTLREQFEALTAVLELVDSADVVVREADNGLNLALRINLSKPLKKP